MRIGQTCMKDHKLEDLTELINDTEISSLERVVSEIIRVFNDPKSSARDLQEVIQIDPPLSGKVLRRANSAYYARPRRVDDIRQAVILIGFEAVRDLALSQKVFEIFADDIKIYGYSRVGLWKQSLAVALIARSIYKKIFKERGDNAYATGILHNIGIIVEDQFYYEQFARALKRCEDKEGDLVGMEDQELGVNHALIGMALSNNWNLPVHLVMGIGYHHNPEAAPEEYYRIAATLFTADAMCQKYGIGYTHTPNLNDQRFQNIVRKLDLSPEALEPIARDAASNIRKMEQYDWFAIME